MDGKPHHQLTMSRCVVTRRACVNTRRAPAINSEIQLIVRVLYESTRNVIKIACCIFFKQKDDNENESFFFSRVLIKYRKDIIIHSYSRTLQRIWSWCGPWSLGRPRSSVARFACCEKRRTKSCWKGMCLINRHLTNICSTLYPDSTMILSTGYSEMKGQVKDEREKNIPTSESTRQTVATCAISMFIVLPLALSPSRLVYSCFYTLVIIILN